jgi:hypothetical protein
VETDGHLDKSRQARPQEQNLESRRYPPRGECPTSTLVSALLQEDKGFNSRFLFRPLLGEEKEEARGFEQLQLVDATVITKS